MELFRESQTSMTTSEFDHQWRREMTQGLHESGIVEGLRSRKLDFPNICNLFHRFFFQVYKTIICSPVLLIHFFCYFVYGKRPARHLRVSHLSLLFMFLWILFLPNMIK